MEGTDNLERSNRIFTIPNLLSFFRICLIPVIVWLYCSRKEYLWTAAVLLLSGLTDIADGFIARHFHMVSTVGKVLDPVADKLTQGAMLFCLLTRFPAMLAMLLLLIIKELFDGLTGLLVIWRTKEVYGADGHGKLVTFLLYAMMFVHLVWYDIPLELSNVLLGICAVTMVRSLVMYGSRNLKILMNEKQRVK